jgi:catechol-2,3-dioxygenase
LWFDVGGIRAGMTVIAALARLAVRDLSAAADWYEPLLGAGSRPMPHVIEWQLEGGGGLQVYTAPERAGRGSCTIIVSDVDEIARMLRTSGLAPQAETADHERVDTVTVKDPDGNSVAFAAKKDDTLAWWADHAWWADYEGHGADPFEAVLKFVCS